ncbi:hypothetical protein SARC_01275 [Sphaeroforma arctica JP610]|uniref:Uncharacterized protein n=1 Tax=Sphaeroforma arctica JP610 TaxID=667725 RepID=A0A0L0GCG9_9EUKA|nr:hypothetical protein SARC_01275 [Sphaeroforma arctica JP610]KNC86594.1 hypothetical protein SARC_01275 [Sphaeroforma arctica JP610]|eukprot:XP_014160496.1 hypothetical protein SARC_01275 [Sphaeroforma arctica JP610]
MMKCYQSEAQGHIDSQQQRALLTQQNANHWEEIVLEKHQAAFQNTQLQTQALNEINNMKQTKAMLTQDIEDLKNKKRSICDEIMGLPQFLTQQKVISDKVCAFTMSIRTQTAKHLRDMLAQMSKRSAEELDDAAAVKRRRVDPMDLCP